MKQESSNRDNILSCAQRLFFEKGYDAVGVQEIVDTAGITKPTMYYYFKSKQGLLESLLEEGGREFGEALREATLSEGDFKEAFLKLTNRYIDIALEYKEFYLMLVSLFSSARENEAYMAAKPYIVDFLGLLREFFGRFVDTNEAIRGREDILSYTYAGSINMYLMVEFERRELDIKSSREDFVQELTLQYGYI